MADVGHSVEDTTRTVTMALASLLWYDASTSSPDGSRI